MANHSAPESRDKSWTASLPIMTVLFLFVCGIYAFLMYYGFIHTPDNPWKQMG